MSVHTCACEQPSFLLTERKATMTKTVEWELCQAVRKCGECNFCKKPPRRTYKDYRVGWRRKYEKFVFADEKGTVTW